MAIASPSAPSFCCTTRSGFTQRRFSQSISPRHWRNVSSLVLARSAITSRFNSDGELSRELNRNSHHRPSGSFPVYVTLPADVLEPKMHTMRRKKVMEASLRALAVGRVEGVVMEVWWGLVEREFPRRYNWQGYLEIVQMAQRHGLKVRAVMAFHQFGSGPNDPFWIPLPRWVLEVMDEDPDVSYADRFGRRNTEYISLGCDILPVLHGRSPIQAYADFMRSFRETFRSYLGGIITGIQVGLGPGGELKYPSFPTQNPSYVWRSREIGEFQCYDKYMIASLNARAGEIGKYEWGNRGPFGSDRPIQDSEITEFFKPDGSWKTPYGEFFLGWYSGMLLLHGERICREAKMIFGGSEVNMSGKVAGVYWHYGTQSHASELTSGYYNTATRDGLTPIVRMFGRHGFSVCCSCFEMQDAKEKLVSPVSRPESFLKQLMQAVRIYGVPVEGENFWPTLDDELFQQVVRMSKLYSDGLESPSFSFNYLRMDKHFFVPQNWMRFDRFVRQLSGRDMLQANLDIGGGGNAANTSAAADVTVVAC